MPIGMIIGCIIDFAVGLACIIIGLMVWKKQKLSLLHDYPYKHVKRADIPAYTRQIGIGIFIIGAGICITGVLNLFESSVWWIPLFGGIAAGLIIMYMAQKKYNGSVLG